MSAIHCSAQPKKSAGNARYAIFKTKQWVVYCLNDKKSKKQIVINKSANKSNPRYCTLNDKLGALHCSKFCLNMLSVLVSWQELGNHILHS